MYFLFLWEVVKRAFTPAPRVTDMLQILAASALPATSKFVGLELPQNAGESALAYIGLIALSFIVIRLFWAPYAIWKDQGAEIGGLKLELSLPERLILSNLAKHRAKARVKLIKSILLMGLKSFGADKTEVSTACFRAVSYAHAAGYGDDVRYAITTYSDICRYDPNNDFCGRFDAEESLIKLFNGEITIEAVQSRLQPYIEQKRLL